MVKAALADYKTAPLDEKLRATLALLEKVTLAPSEVTAADVAPALAAGVTRAAIEEALWVAYVFAIFNRMADALSFALLPPETLPKVARMLLRRGYK